MQTFSRNFPLQTIQSGAALGNGYTGVLLWGTGNTLNVTIGCANLWDHRDYGKWDERMSYRALRAALDNGELQNFLQSLRDPEQGRRLKPTLIPMGRVVITLPAGSELLRYDQVFSTGITTIVYRRPDGTDASFEFAADLSMRDIAACRNLPADTGVELISAYHLSLSKGNDSLKDGRGFQEPSLCQLADASAFTQKMPADPEYSVLCRRHDDGFVLSMRRGQVDLDKWQTGTQGEIFNASAKWFRNFFSDVPAVDCGDAELNEIYWHGMYKYGIISNPAGVSPGLQGPWIEDDSLPPWSGDYHFNVNVQMCNSPGFKSGKFTHLKPLFDMVLSWKETLRHNARCFAGIENGYLLPTAVDDCGRKFGGFGLTSTDNGCTAWIANMMFDYCDYSGDTRFLREQVYDFMLGTLRVYREMCDRNEDGTLSLPVAVSPEYGEYFTAVQAWGRNASFQLAAAHRLAGNIIRAAEILETECEPAALEIREKLPLFSVKEGRIAIWEGELLSESHRHHSHLAAIYPFTIIDPQDEKYAELVQSSIGYWVYRGMGMWTGWCMPWAAQLQTMVGNAEMALLTLKIWRTLFTNDGGGSLHDANSRGFTCLAKIRPEIMQIDGAMGCVNAIQDLFAHQCGDITRIFYGFPQRAPASSFENMHLPGFKISGSRDAHNATVTVTAARDGNLALQLPGTGIFRRAMKAGETIRVTRTPANGLAEIAE